MMKECKKLVCKCSKFSIAQQHNVTEIWSGSSAEFESFETEIHQPYVTNPQRYKNTKALEKSSSQSGHSHFLYSFDFGE